MRYREVDVVTNPQLHRKVKALYESAFPKEERIPWWLLLVSSHRKGVGLSAWLDGEVFCGFTAWVTVENMHFLLFFAVEEDQRGKGCGSAILAELQKQFPSVTLNVELLDPAAENYDQRVRRISFYRRNGFYDTGWDVWEIGGQFRVLSTRQRLDVRTYRKVFRKLGCGIWNVKLKEERKS